MIKPKSPKSDPDKRFSVLDIENLADGTVIAIGHSWREGDSIQHRVFSCWEDWWSWVIPQAKQLKCFRTIYADNGGGWDWTSFLQWFVESKDRLEECSVGLISAQSNLIFLDVGFVRDKGTDKQHNRLSIKLCDSLYLLRSKLNDLALKILGKDHAKTESKIEDVWFAWENDKERFYRYLRADCELLLFVLEKSLDLIRERIAKVGKLGLTIGSLALDVYRTSMPDITIYTDLPPDVERFCRDGYHGGRVEVFKHGYYPSINVYDINSLYPFAMVSTDIPLSARGGWTTYLRDNRPGVYEIAYRQYRKDIPPVLLDQSGNGAYSGSGVFYSPELHLLREMDIRADIQIRRGWVFMDCGKPFDDFVGRVYDLRLENDPAVSLLCKYILNSLYGKFGQRGDREKLVVFDSIESAMEARRAVAEYNQTAEQKGTPTKSLEPILLSEELEDGIDTLIYTESEQRTIDHAHVAIAGVITSRARVELYRFGTLAGWDTVVYSDTDSIHTTATVLDSHCSNVLGQLKPEFRGEGVYCGKKLYGLRDKQTEKIRAKGISVRKGSGDYGADVGFNELVALLQGGSYNCSFKRPATFRGVLSGLQSCSLTTVERNRRIRKT